MDRKLYQSHKLYYKRRPSAKPETFPGLKDALPALVSEDETADDWRINGVSKELALCVGREEMESENQVGSVSSTPRLTLVHLDKKPTRESVSAPNFGYEQLRDSKVYKRTRYLYQSPKEPGQWPVGLELAGKRINDKQSGSTETQENDNAVERQNTPYEKENLQKLLENIPRLSRAGTRAPGSPMRPHKVCLSPSFYSDFGLRSERTDTFSGLRRVKNFNSSYEEEIARKANRHIYACQTQSSSRRGSRAARSVNALKETLGPSRGTAAAFDIPTQYVRSVTRSLSRNATFVDVARKPSYALFIKTRDTPEYGMRRNKTDPLPEISGRTLVLGYEDRVIL